MGWGESCASGEPQPEGKTVLSPKLPGMEATSPIPHFPSPR